MQQMGCMSWVITLGDSVHLQSFVDEITQSWGLWLTCSEIPGNFLLVTRLTQAELLLRTNWFLCLNRKTLLPKAQLVKMYMCSLLSSSSKEVKVVFFCCKYNFSKSKKFLTAVTNSLTDFLRMLLANTLLDFFVVLLPSTGNTICCSTTEVSQNKWTKKDLMLLTRWLPLRAPLKRWVFKGRDFCMLPHSWDRFCCSGVKRYRFSVHLGTCKSTCPCCVVEKPF